MSTPPRLIPVSVLDLRELDRLVTTALVEVRSNGRMYEREKNSVLTRLRKAQGVVKGLLQLEMFAPGQLETD